MRSVDDQNWPPARIPSNRMAIYRKLLYSAANSPTIILENSSLLFYENGRFARKNIPISVPNSNRIILKCEHLSQYNPTGSLYDRLYPWLFVRAERAGIISPEDSDLIECSVGNAGAAFAYVARELGYKNYSVILPIDIYGARKDQIEHHLGAKVLFSPAKIGPIGYIEMLEQLLSANREQRRGKSPVGRLYPISKIRKIPMEPYAAIVREAQDALVSLNVPSKIDYFVFGVGAGNTISMIGKCVKSQSEYSQVIACEHAENPFVAHFKQGTEPPMGGSWSEKDYPATAIHGVPLSKLNLDLSIIDDVILTTRHERDNGLFIANTLIGLKAGRPSGMMVSSALKIAENSENSNILTTIFDSEAKYSEVWKPIFSLDNLRDNKPKIVWRGLTHA